MSEAVCVCVCEGVGEREGGREGDQEKEILGLLICMFFFSGSV